MKTAVSILVVFLSLFINLSNAFSQKDWQYISSTDKYAIYADFTSLRTLSDGSYQIQFKYDCFTDCEYEEGTEDYVLRWIAFSCSRQSMMLFRPVTYYKDGNTYEDEPLKKVWIPVEEGSIAYEILIALCE